jgi:hypothetical protein
MARVVSASTRRLLFFAQLRVRLAQQALRGFLSILLSLLQAERSRQSGKTISATDEH